MRKSELKILIKEIVQLCLEDPDTTYYPNKDGSYEQLYYGDLSNIEAIVFFPMRPANSYYAYLPRQSQFISSNKEHQQILQKWRESRNTYIINMHNHALDAIKIAIPELEGIWARGLNARLFTYNNEFIFSFWEGLNLVQESEILIRDFLKDIHININKVYFEPAGFEKKLLTANQLFNDSSIKSAISTDQMKDKEELHLMGPERKKKEMLRRKMNYARKDQEMARKAKMPVAQLRQYYPGMSVAENNTSNKK